MERQKQKEETTEETDKLDKDWTAVHSILIHQLKPVATNVKKDDYDKAVKSLIFETKAKPTDRLKTDEELAKYGIFSLEFVLHLRTVCSQFTLCIQTVLF